MDIFSLLKRDHRHARTLLNELAAGEDLSRRERVEILIELQALMMAHNQAEETVFYNALAQHASTRHLALRSEREHEMAEDLMAQLCSERDEDRWRDVLEQLRIAMERHIEEEERVVFAAACEVLSDSQIRRLTEDMCIERVEQLGDSPR